MKTEQKKRYWFIDIFLFFAYVFAGFYLVVNGINDIPLFAEKWDNNIYVLFYALGVMGLTIIITLKAMSILLDGYE